MAAPRCELRMATDVVVQLLLERWLHRCGGLCYRCRRWRVHVNCLWGDSFLEVSRIELFHEVLEHLLVVDRGHQQRFRCASWRLHPELHPIHSIVALDGCSVVSRDEARSIQLDDLPRWGRELVALAAVWWKPGAAAMVR